jgi:dolichol kinase
MVVMFLPATYVDPSFAALALAIVLASFLLLDLLRASQLPPLSKPLAYFLAPYVDGRDLRGPVVVSHIFLLIGCAIPLWLSLGSLPRTGYGHLQGWGVPTREVGMVSGVVCVGLGDAAASLIGRRYGHRKWLWGGGKSLEGSAAFVAAVFLGLMVAHTWLHIGGWTATSGHLDTWQTTIQKTGGCAVVASLTEAVLTGGNDNVIVPVVLWTCVKSLGV